MKKVKKKKRYVGRTGTSRKGNGVGVGVWMRLQYILYMNVIVKNKNFFYKNTF